MSKAWRVFNPNEDLTQAFSQELGISPLTAQVLINRGVKDLKEAEVFLNPRMNRLRDPMEIPEIEKAARRCRDEI